MKAWASTDIIYQNNLLSCIVMRSKRLVHEPLKVILVLMEIERYLRTHGEKTEKVVYAEQNIKNN